MATDQWSAKSVGKLFDSPFCAGHIPDEYWSSVPLPSLQSNVAFLVVYFGSTRVYQGTRAPASPRYLGTVRFPDQEIDWETLAPDAFLVTDDDLHVLLDQDVMSRARALLPLRGKLLARHRELLDLLLGEEWMQRAGKVTPESRAVAEEWVPLMDSLFPPQLLWLYKKIAQPLRQWIEVQLQ